MSGQLRDLCMYVACLASVCVSLLCLGSQLCFIFLVTEKRKDMEACSHGCVALGVSSVFWVLGFHLWWSFIRVGI